MGQLIRENNKSLDKTYVYEYNESGNITAAKTYAYTTGAVSGTPTTEAYVYDSAIKDRLHSYKGSVISYDSNGYPTSFTSNGITHTFTWTKGKLTKYVKSTSLAGKSTYTYTYDGYGRRISKRYSFMKGSQSMASYVTMSLTNYTYDTSGRLIRENLTETYNDFTSVTRDILYLYDESGIVGAVQTYNSTTETFYFDRNIKGDVIGIYNASGTKIANYSYDSWGNSKLVTLVTNNFSGYNPIRYRGYYFDAESGFYFLNARYYNPAWRRFISPDDTAYLDPDTPNGLNLYAYCNNDPVNYADPSGNFAVSLAIAGLIVGAVIGATIGGIIAYNAAKDNDSEGWKLFGWTALGIIGGGVLGGAIGYGIGYYWPLISSFLSSSFSFTIPTFGAVNAGGALALSGGITITVSGAQIVGGALAIGLGILMFAKGYGPRMGHNQYENQMWEEAMRKKNIKDKDLRKRIHQKLKKYPYAETLEELIEIVEDILATMGKM